jgi:SnoaL-like polyketide cyclase
VIFLSTPVVSRYFVHARVLYMNIPATGKTVKYSGIAIFRIANGKIEEQWQEADAVGLMQQLSEGTSQSVTEPLGRRETESLQHQREATPPIEEVR